MTYINDTGYPSVTEIINPFIDDEWFTEEHSNRGSAVHAACASHMLGLYVVPLSQQYQPYFDSFMRWCDIVKPETIEVEKRLIETRLGFCGQLDLACWVGKELRIIDFKTSQAKYLWWRLQGAAYRHLWDNNECDRSLGGGSLRLSSEGRTAIYDPWPKSYQNEFNIFLGALNLHKFFN